MELEKEIETPFGTVRFKGTVTDDELDYIIKIGLMAMMARGQIKAQFITVDGEPVEDDLDEPLLDDTPPTKQDIIQ